MVLFVGVCFSAFPKSPVNDMFYLFLFAENPESPLSHVVDVADSYPGEHTSIPRASRKLSMGSA